LAARQVFLSRRNAFSRVASGTESSAFGRIAFGSPAESLPPSQTSLAVASFV